ncbi:Hint domain-containing protein [Acidocella sp.]|uniref:Hint domain-containing protein n=1 Tax=Acidocella sp. TaxID=50710 RepID=UPI002604A239|nr:Hint domain-containing protein [Acidocella sp.]
MPATTISAYTTTPARLSTAGAALTLTPTATIAAGSATGVVLAASGQSVQNAGTITSLGTAIAGYSLASVTNSGLLAGYQTGLALGPQNHLANTGTIRAGAVSGTGITLGPADALSNSGLITGARGLYYFGTGGTETILNTGTISGSQEGIALFGANATIINQGTISGATMALTDSNLLATPHLDLILTPGAVLSGGVNVSGGDFALTLASGLTSGTLGLGSISGLTSLALAPTASWTITAPSAELAAIQTIAGLTSQDELILTDLTSPATLTIGTPGLVTLTSASLTTTLALAGAQPGSNSYNLVKTASGAYALTAQAICYLRGTHILTPTGPRPIEQLRIGDLVITRFTGIRPIRWIGRQTLRPTHHSPALAPIRISPGALGPGQPARPLYVSPGHALLINGQLILARLLQNGTTITQPPTPPLIEYYQLDLGTHECIIAEGTYAETYADAGAMRAQFDNAAEFDRLHPHHLPPEEPVLCAPRPLKGRRLAAALATLPVAAVAA